MSIITWVNSDCFTRIDYTQYTAKPDFMHACMVWPAFYILLYIDMACEILSIHSVYGPLSSCMDLCKFQLVHFVAEQGNAIRELVPMFPLPTHIILCHSHYCMMPNLQAKSV